MAAQKKRRVVKRAKKRLTKKPRRARTGVRTKKKTRRASAGAAKAKPPIAPLVEKIGEITHYFPRVKAAALVIRKGKIRLNDAVYIKGHTTDFKQTVKSIQLDHEPIQEGGKGQEIGMLVKSRVRIGDSVYRI